MRQGAIYMGVPSYMVKIQVVVERTGEWDPTQRALPEEKRNVEFSVSKDQLNQAQHVLNAGGAVFTMALQSAVIAELKRFDAGLVKP